MTALTEALERALRCREAGDDVGLLTALLEAWRLAPDDALAAGIDQVSLRIEPTVTRGMDPIGRDLRRKTWRSIASRGRPEDVPWLLGVHAAAGWATPEDLEYFARADPDPRIARVLFGVRRRFNEDNRVLDPLLKHRLGYRLAPTPIPAGARDIHARVARPYLEVQAVERSFLEEVWADPDDDAPRLVYADWLMDRGHPRGELTSLQFADQRGELTEAQRARHFRLVSRLGDELLGGIAGAMFTTTFERGFFASGNLWLDPAELAPTIGRPEWATARGLTYPSHRHVPQLIDLVSHPVMKGLRSLGGFGGEAFLALATQPIAMPIEHLGFVLNAPPTPRQAEVLITGATFHQVRAGHIGGKRGALAWLPGSAFAAQLERLTVVCAASEAPLWLRDRDEGRFPRLGALEIWLHEFGTLSARGEVLQADLVAPELLMGILNALDPETFREVRFNPRPNTPAYPPLRAAAARHGDFVETG